MQIRLVIIFICFASFFLLAYGFIIYRKRSAYKKIKYRLCDIDSSITVEINKDKTYDFLLKYLDKKILIKVLYNIHCDELCINAKNYWQLNTGAISSRKSGEKLKNVYDLVNYQTNYIKVYLFYPNIKRIMRAINECEIVKVTPKMKIFGSYFINYEDLDLSFINFITLGN